MSIEIREVKTAKDLRTYIYLPEKIHANHPNWVHPLYIDEKVFYNPKKNKSFSYCDTVLALAWKDGKPVGRIMGIINNRYNELHQERNARFAFLDCEKDLNVCRALLEYIENWARNKGMIKLVGPLAFSDKDPQGFLIEGFNERVVIATNYNFPWMPEFIEKLGYAKEVDLVSYKLIIPEEIPEFYTKIYERIMVNHQYVLQEFTTKKELKPWIVPIFRLINEAYADIYGFIPLQEKEMYELAGRYLPVLDPRFIKVITSPEGEVLAFIVAMPELSEGIRKARGRLLPFGIFHILRESKRTKMLTTLLGAIKEPYRGKGLDSILAIKTLESAKKAGMELIDSHLILEHNTRMRAEYEHVNGILHKRYRIFQKPL
ncbi:MAG TPA: hypothetical protein PLC81_00050 [Bacteroidales bacterium]|nr:hypothetical protein [Bacteroidales bacterium]HQK36004.1 hypothetical protein [Bacteroidales bacterium]